MKTSTIIVALFWCSCRVQPANLQVAQQFLDVVACCLHPPVDSFKSCIVIPDEGCSGCIKKSTLFVVNKIDSLSNTLIIFTGVRDMKVLSMKVGKEFLLRKNVLIDSSDILKNPAFSSIYPQKIELKSGRAARVSIVQLP
ncbi:MAG: hypothetical protein ACE5FF_12790 [Saprospiraceae bacterium]